MKNDYFLLEKYHDILEDGAIAPELYDKYDVKKGLRNNNGTGVLVGLSAKKVELGHEFDLSAISIEGYDLEFYVDEAGTAKIDKLTEVHTSCDECSYIEVYVKVTKK